MKNSLKLLTAIFIFSALSSLKAITIILPEAGNDGSFYEKAHRDDIEVLNWSSKKIRLGNIDERKSIFLNDARNDYGFTSILHNCSGDTDLNSIINVIVPDPDESIVVARGAFELAKRIVELKSLGNNDITLEGYGRGGYVACLASHLLEPPSRGYNSTMVLSGLIAITSALKAIPGMSLLSGALAIPRDRMIELEKKLRDGPWNVEASIKEFKPKIQDQIGRDQIRGQSFLKLVRLIGTPNAITDFKPCMETVRNCDNFYSTGDIEASIKGGLLADEQSGRVTNLQIIFPGSFCNKNPGHSDLIYSSHLQNHIDNIPSIFKNFEEGEKGVIRFFTKDNPSYKLDENVCCLGGRGWLGCFCRLCN
jgi:hypothetical protein